MVPLSRYIVFFSLAGGGCAVDLATKTWMFNHLGFGPNGQTWWLWTDVFGFQTSLNRGALFGIGQGMTPVFAALSIGAAAGILVWLFFVGAAREWWLTVALASIVAGIFGNLYDRLGLPGLVYPEGYPGHLAGEPVYAVRDFILMVFDKWPWPTYNVADSLLVCGAAMLMWHAFFTKAEDSGGRDQRLENEG